MPRHEGPGLHVIANFCDFFSNLYTPDKDNVYII